MACGTYDLPCIVKDLVLVWLAAHWLFLVLGGLALVLIVVGPGLRMRLVGIIIGAVLVVYLIGFPQLGLAAHPFLIGIAAVRKPRGDDERVTLEVETPKGDPVEIDLSLAPVVTESNGTLKARIRRGEVRVRKHQRAGGDR